MLKRTFAIIVAAMLSMLMHASAVPVDYAGHYEVIDNNPSRVFTFDLRPSGARFKVNFFAEVMDSPGAKPTGKGLGWVNDDGILEFTFTDSFANEGVGTLQPASNGYKVEMRITKFVDPAPLHFYGDLTMRKTSNSH